MKEKTSLVQQCLAILKRDDIKSEFRNLLEPIIGFMFYEMSTYIYIIVAFGGLLFIMILTILIILIIIITNRQSISKIL